MDEMLKMYRKLPMLLQDVSDYNTVINADITLGKIEEIHPDVLEDSYKYVDCFRADQSSRFNVCVIGADGHAIVSVIRKTFPDATVLWFPNPKVNNDKYQRTMHGMILSDMAVRDLFDGKFNFDEITKVLIEDGFILFETLTGCIQNTCFTMMNKYGIVPFKLFNGNIMYSIYKGRHSIVNRSNDKSEHLCNYNRIYCVCPAHVKSGGPELMHQLVYHINRLGGNADIAYINSKEAGGWTVPEFAGYITGHITTFEEIEDVEGNAVVIPEGWPFAIDMIKNTDVFFWWLSVDNFKILFDNEEEIKLSLEKVDRRAYMHLVQSEYARHYLISSCVDDKRIQYLSDYINEAYLKKTVEISTMNRVDRVLYNPKKGREFVDKLIAGTPDINWTAIENMTTDQVRQLMESSKVYIDFGNHPGKDRIPREAAMCGCLVITGRKGSASFPEDVPIPDRFKLDENTESDQRIIEVIRECLADYDLLINEYADYRKTILSEKDRFVEDVTKVFFDH